MRSIKPSLLKCNNICYIWSYKFITIIFGMNIIYPIIDYLYLILLYFLFIIMFYTCSRIYIEYYIYTTLPGRDISIYYKKENTIIVAIDKNNIIGFVSLKYISNNIGWMTYLFVDPIYHNKGIAKQLVNIILYKFGKKHQYKSVYGGTSSLQYAQVYFVNKYSDKVKNYVNWIKFPVYKIIYMFQIK